MKPSVFENMDDHWRDKSRSRLKQLKQELDKGAPSGLSCKRIQRVVEDVLERFGEGAKILDIGCGTGHSIYAMRKAGIDAEGIEPSEVAREICSELLGISVRDGSVYDLSGWYDAVVITEVLEHMQWPERALHEVAKVTKTVYFSTPEGQNPASLPNKEGVKLHTKYHMREWWPESFQEFIEGITEFRVVWQEVVEGHIEACYSRP